MISNLSFVKKRDYYSRILTIFLLCIDLFSFGLAARIISKQSLNLDPDLFFPYVFISALSWIITTAYSKLYTRKKLKSIKAIFYKHLEALPLLIGLQLAAFFFTDSSSEILIPILALNFYTVIFSTFVKSSFLFVYKEMHLQHRSRYIIVGYSEMGQKLFEYLQHEKNHSHQFMGFFDDKFEKQGLFAGKVDEMYQYCRKHNISQIYLATNASPSLVSKIANFADSHFIYFGYVVNQTQLEKSLHPTETELFSRQKKKPSFQTIYV